MNDWTSFKNCIVDLGELNVKLLKIKIFIIYLIFFFSLKKNRQASGYGTFLSTERS